MTRNGQFCMAKIKYTLIQGHFYERLLFYMDSCALSPMASLFLSEVETKIAEFLPTEWVDIMPESMKYGKILNCSLLVVNNHIWIGVVVGGVGWVGW